MCYFFSRSFNLYIIGWYFLFIGTGLSLNSQTISPDQGKMITIMVNARVQESPPRVDLYWPADTSGVAWEIYRKFPGDRKWGVSLDSLSNNDTSFSDTTVKYGKEYEYFVTRLDSNGDQTAWGYLSAGIKVPPVAYRGNFLLVIDSAFWPGLKPEISRLMLDLTGDGWQVVKRLVSRNDSVKKVKRLIRKVYNKYNSELGGVLLLGHVPVPYSGNYPFDGHPDHSGAWPADLYYSEMDAIWTDVNIDNTSPVRKENDNVPGDGKFDQSSWEPVAAGLDFPIGRVDMAKLPAFKSGEEALLKRYLDKDHAYRTGKVRVKFRGIVEDNFNFSDEPFSQNGWRNFSGLLGNSNVVNGDPFTRLQNGHYIWFYGAGHGGFDSARGIGSTKDLVNDSLQGVFMMLFGSYFGDWDSKNNFLRAPLAHKGPALTNVWSGRPNYFFHQMAMGAPIGYSFLKSQNNLRPKPGTGATYEFTGKFAGGIHTALMGDPSLRLHVVSPPANLSAVSVNQGTQVRLSWDTSNDKVAGYHIYVFDTQQDRYIRINEKTVKKNRFLHAYPGNDTLQYMVRALQLQPVPGGSYYNLSQGIFDTAMVSRPLKLDLSLLQDTLCKDDSFVVNLSSDHTFQPGNEFFVLLSDSSGNFSGSVDTVARLKDTIAGKLNGFVAASLPASGSYRIRAVSTKPAFSGNIYKNNLALTGPPAKPVITDSAGSLVILPANDIQWFRNGNSLKDANKPSYDPFRTGQYHVVVQNDAGCINVSDPFTVKSRIWIMPISDTVLCAGDSFEVDFQTGRSFDTGNVFKLQLSDSAGNFSKKPFIAGETKDTAGGQIEGILPDSLEGTGYRLRVVAGEPYFLGSVLEKSLDINPLPKKPVIAWNGNKLAIYSKHHIQWYKEGKKLPGDTGSLLVVSESGIYSVAVVNRFGCMIMSDTVIVNLDGIENHTFGNKISIYPNPVHDNMWIHVTGLKREQLRLKLLDLPGKIRMQKEIVIDQGKIRLDMRSVPPGMYILEVKGNSMEVRNKILIY